MEERTTLLSELHQSICGLQAELGEAPETSTATFSDSDLSSAREQKLREQLEGAEMSALLQARPRARQLRGRVLPRVLPAVEVGKRLASGGVRARPFGRWVEGCGRGNACAP